MAAAQCCARRQLTGTRAAATVVLVTVALLLLTLAHPNGHNLTYVQSPAGGRRSALVGSGGALLATFPGFGGLLAAPATASARLTLEEERQIGLFLRSSPSVVGITQAPRGASNRAAIVGSGFVWDQDHIVTNFHVLAEAGQPHVTFLTTDEKGNPVRNTLPAVVVGADPLSDIALLQVPELMMARLQAKIDASAQKDAKDDVVVESRQIAQRAEELMRPLQRGISSSLLPGQEVYALGNPFGMEHSMSRGVVSGLPRTMMLSSGRPLSGIIQTDASINPGNSGGPLLDSDGRVIGINSAILSDQGTFSGVGLAIPIDTVEHHVSSMIFKGFVSRASLGVTFAPTGMSQALGIDGVVVMQVVPGGPAARAGVRALRKDRLGDVIISIEGRQVGSASDIVQVLDKFDPGKTVRVRLQRASSDIDSDGYEYVNLDVKLGALNSPKLIA